jgi:hypothetical protein
VRLDWLPVSAALLLTGALALCLGGYLLPQTDDAADALRIVDEQGGRWMAAAVILFVAAICLSLGLPAILTLVQHRGWTLGVVAAIVLEVGFIGTAGLAMLMGFFRALVNTHAIQGQGLDDVASDAGLAIFFYAWLVGLYLGELLLAIALFRAATTPRWVPVALVGHVATLAVTGLLPEYLSKSTALLLVLGFAGIAVQAASPQTRRRLT